MKEKILVTGGGGYVGSVLVPKLVSKGYDVRVLDLMIFGEDSLKSVEGKCEIIKGDIRDSRLVKKCLQGVSQVIHLAAISNDPCSDLNPLLTQEVNLEASKNLAVEAKRNKARRFIFSSSSSVYGIREEENVTEELKLRPLTLYSSTKAQFENFLKRINSPDFSTLSIRSATVCGYSPRQRLDVVVNIFASKAIIKGEITVNGGEQRRPNVHIEDITDLYMDLLGVDSQKTSGRIFNYGSENHTLNKLAEITKEVIGPHVRIVQNPRNPDSRDYHISSEKIKNELGFYPSKTIKESVKDLKDAFDNGLILHPESSIYRNIERMKELNLK